MSCGGSSVSNKPDGGGPGDGSGSSIDAPAVDAPAATACTASAQMRCAKLQTCSPSDLEKRFGELTTCEAREALTCTEALAAPNTAQNPTAIEACTSAIAAESCTDFFTKAPPTACATPDGPGAGSSACGFSAQCETGFCSLDTIDVCAVCAPQPKVGDACATSGCGQDLVCVTATLTCQAPVVAAGACDKDLLCADGFTCVGANNTTTPLTPGSCVANVATAGSACDPKHKTLADCSADGGLTCDTTLLTCVAQPLVGAGSACGLIGTTHTACTGGGTCITAGSATAGTCVAPAVDGAACDSVLGPDCLTPAKCIPAVGGSGTAGSCQLPGSQTCE